MAKAQGHITVRRRPKNGEQGEVGISYRVSFWQSGKKYHYDLNLTGGATERIIDICVNKPLSLIGDSGFKAYQCIRTHTSSDSIPLGNVNYWTAVNNLQPLVSPLILANRISADFIDVDTLSVKHLNGADGSFAGVLQFPFVNLIESSHFDYSTGSGTDMYYTMSDSVASLEILASQRYYGNPYDSSARYNHFTLPTMPNGTVLNIIGYGNIKNIIRPVYFTGDIIYNTNDSMTGYSLAHTSQLTCKDQFFLRMMSYDGKWFVITILGAYEVS